MLPVSWDTVRLFLHVLAATIWVGGQLTLAALVPVLRRLGAEVPRAAARAFNLVAWPAFAVLLVTGVWNVIAVRGQISGSYQVTLIVKLVVVVISGAAAALHALFARAGKSDEPVCYEVQTHHSGTSFATLGLIARQSQGVLATASRAAPAARSRTPARVVSPSLTARSTDSAAVRTTVRMVPSTGRSTA